MFVSPKTEVPYGLGEDVLIFVGLAKSPPRAFLVPRRLTSIASRCGMEAIVQEVAAE